MLSPWSEMPEDFTLEEYLERFGDAIEARAADYRGIWAEACFPLEDMGATEDSSCDMRIGARYREVRLDLGCGKGFFTVRSAIQEPDVLFVGIDIDPVCVAFAARLAIESDAHNAVFVPGRDGTLADIFAPGELSTIYLNFPTPHPKGREAASRLTHVDRLTVYRDLLGEDGLLKLRTDNHPFYAYSLAQLEAAGYDVLERSADARDELPATPETAYEQRAIAMGARICAITARPGVKPALIGRTAPASLYDYLSDDFDTTGYIPPEMARGITAIRNATAHGGSTRKPEHRNLRGDGNPASRWSSDSR